MKEIKINPNMRQILNLISMYILTPTAIFINVGEWFKQLTINQGFTIVISTFVVIFWAFKTRKIYIESQIAKKRLEMME